VTTVAQIFAVLAGLGHIGAFVMESLAFDRPRVQRLLVGRAGSPPEVRLWAFNQGFYNLFLAAGALIGTYAWVTDHETVGRTLVVFSCSAMALAGIVLFGSDRRLWRGALAQLVPAALAVAATLAA
jgi:putative membrane protein